MVVMILAFDFATTTGWASGNPGEQPVYGSIKLSKASPTHGEIAANAVAWLIDFLGELKPTMIVFEEPLAPNFTAGHTTLKTAMVTMGLPFMMQGVAYKLGLFNVAAVRVSEVRTFFLGGNLRSDDAEKLTLQRCRKFGWAPKDHNEADALALWCYQCAQVDPTLAHKITPLFGGAQL
jgi:hypothetical protein